MEKLLYRDAPVPDQIHEVARVAAEQCGFDMFAEILLASSVLAVRWVSEDSVRTLYPEFFRPPISLSPDKIVRVDWLTWAVSKKFDGRFEKAVIARAESIVVDLPTLLERQVFTHGLEPEFHWLDWEEISAPPSEPPAAVFEALGNLILGEWRQYVRKQADGIPSYIEGVHPKLRPYIYTAISTNVALQ
jgi:hypothetical protein